MNSHLKNLVPGKRTLSSQQETLHPTRFRNSGNCFLTHSIWADLSVHSSIRECSWSSCVFSCRQGWNRHSRRSAQSNRRRLSPVIANRIKLLAIVPLFTPTSIVSLEQRWSIEIDSKLRTLFLSLAQYFSPFVLVRKCEMLGWRAQSENSRINIRTGAFVSAPFQKPKFVPP